MGYMIVIMSLVAFNIIMLIANKNWFDECIKRNEEWANYYIKINNE